MSEKKLFLLDGHALVYRAHYAFIARPMINSKGINTSCIVGMTRFIWDVIRNQNPTHIAVSFDLPGGTFRHEVFPEYKANREAQPEDITTALPYIREIIEGFKIPVVTKEGFEADDVIGTLAKQAEKEGFKVYMVTPDKDYAQLVSENIFMYKPSRSGRGIEILGVPEILEKWDIQRVEQVIDILGLQGDSVDNIPGIPGIGAKTAVKLLKQFDSLEGLLENTDQLKGKQKEKVEQFAEQGRLSKRLATIDINVPVQFDAKRYIIEPYDKDRLGKIFKELEFRTLARQILGDSETAPQAGQQGSLFPTSAGTAASATSPRTSAPAAHSVADKNINNTEHQYHLVDTEKGRKDLLKLLKKQKAFSFDTETTSIQANRAELVGLSFSVKPHEAYYIPTADEAAAKAIVAEFKEVLENEKITKIGQNIKYDAIVLRWHGCEVKGTWFDTMLAHYLLEPGLRHNMDYLAETYLKYQPISITTLIGKKGKNQLTMRDVPVEKVVPYACEDADITLQLADFLRPKLKKENLEKLYYDIEEPLMKALVDMEYNGVNLDESYLEDFSKELEVKIRNAEEAIYKEAGVRFNISSPKQVGEVLFDKMKIPYRWKKTKTGHYSTDETKLTELAKEHDFVNQILAFRSVAKLKSTYVDALPKLVNPRTGRLHSSFNQTLTATGRLSSNNPNLQNIPIRTEEGRKVREAFIPRDKDYILLAADYSQIELRLIAELSGDEAMLGAFQAGHDIHQATAAKVYGKELEEVSKDERRNAKTVNFSIIYGAGATNLSQQLDIPRKEASELIKAYFEQYHGLKSYMETAVANAREKGHVMTLMGRRRILRDIDSRNGMMRSHAERNAINTPIQGTAADMIKIAMIKVQQALREGKFKTKVILQVHDELVFDVYRPELEKVKVIIEDCMKNAIPDLKVPILVGMDVGENWLEAH